MKSVEERFEDKIFYSPDGCWYWTAASSMGYGQFMLNGKSVKAHRLSYEIHKGPVSTELDVLHTCDNSRCVNPDHLYLGNDFDNMRDMIKRGRRNHAIGSRIGISKLTELQVIEIRSQKNPKSTELAKKYGVSRFTIRFIIKRKTWKHI